jgi:hypothetical protein
MKPFQLYTVDRFPRLAPGDSAATQYQMTFSGEGEDVHTTVTMQKRDFEGSLDSLRVQSEVKHETYGFIKTLVDSTRRRLEFYEYLQPVDFHAYYAAQKKIVIFQAPKKVCKGVLSNLQRSESGIALIEMRVEFPKVLELVDEYLGAWFKGVSARVRTAGLSGDQIQHDRLFKNLLVDGKLSNVVIPWEFEGSTHRIMITEHGAIVLVQDYKSNLGLELRIVMDVLDRLLKLVWEPRKTKKDSLEDEFLL